MKNNKIWFVQKTYGWGWTPSTWEGWLTIALYLVALAFISSRIDDSAILPVKDTLIESVLPILFITAILIFICYKKGEKPQWRWGKK